MTENGVNGDLFFLSHDHIYIWASFKKGNQNLVVPPLVHPPGANVLMVLSTEVPLPSLTLLPTFPVLV